MSLYSDLNEILSPYAQRIKRLGGQISEVNESLANFQVEGEITDFTFSQGTINTIHGYDTDIATRCSTGFISFNGAKMTVTPKSGYKVSGRIYSRASIANYDDFTDWSTEALEYSNSSKFYRIVIAKTDDADITPALLPDDVITVKYYDSTDKTLTVDGGIADAKVTGDKIAEIKEDLSGYQSSLGDMQSSLDGMTIVEGAWSVFTPDWERGSINMANGEKLDSNIVARSLGYMALTTGVVRITADESVVYSWRRYNNDETYIFRSAEWLSGAQELAFEAGQKLRIVCKYSDDTAISLEEINSLLTIEEQLNPDVVGKALSPKKVVSGKVEEWEFIDFPVHTDKMLSVEGEPADAKVTGDKFTELTERTQIKMRAEFERGTINNGSGGSTAGTDATSLTRMRTHKQLPMNIVIVPTVLQVSFRLYQNGTIIYTDDSWREGGVYNPLEISQDATSMRLVLRYSDDRVIQSENIVYANENVYLVSDENIVDYILSNQSEQDIKYAKNSVGNNVSVKAAKTIYFDDGTPPYTDWYLLCDGNGFFYRSKDLRSKEKLFTFAPSVSTCDNWSVGIDGNNNIFFIINANNLVGDAAGLDDSVRINPVYFLASENYSTMHTLDFGDNLKPVGWLENVGWLVLPNGDVIMCEYTRPKVKTCNVWHIDSTDITDPNNWQAVWSHDIINDTSVSLPGMKHCHYVAYDFYTGICYFGTGDAEDGSYVYYSSDNGVTWQVAWGPSRKLCRSLNLVFTQDKVYWGSDSWESKYHSFFVAERLSNGVVDGANCTEIPLGQVNAQSCYGCVYLPRHGLVVMMDYNDIANHDALKWQAYDLQSREIVTIHTFDRVSESNLHLGFRCMYVDWYPTGDCILVGFALNQGTHGADEVNSFKGVGNKSTFDGRVNNLLLYVNRIGETFDVRMSTIYV